jgi:hypothetical protein
MTPAVPSQGPPRSDAPGLGNAGAMPNASFACQGREGASRKPRARATRSA